MEFVKDFATFLHQNSALKFGDFTLSSGKKSSYYIDLRLVASFPHQFRKMIKQLQKLVIKNIGLDNFESYASVPTGGLVVASVLAFDTVKPLLYVRNNPKKHGTSNTIEGKIKKGMRVLMIDDVATTGNSVINGIRILKDAGVVVNDVYVIVDRLEGASKFLESEGVRLHHLTDIIEITKILQEQNLVPSDIFEKIKKQVKN